MSENDTIEAIKRDVEVYKRELRRVKAEHAKRFAERAMRATARAASDSHPEDTFSDALQRVNDDKRADEAKIKKMETNIENMEKFVKKSG